MTHGGFHHKLEAVGFGVFIPFFWVASGLHFDGEALFASGSTLAMVPIFLPRSCSPAASPRSSTGRADRA